MKKLLLLILLISVCGCSGGWKQSGEAWQYKTGLSVTPPKIFKPGESSGSTLTFRKADSAYTYLKIQAAPTREEARKAATDRLNTLRSDIGPRNGGPKTFEQAVEMLEAGKNVSVFTLPNITEVAIFTVNLGIKGEGTRWVYYEYSYDARNVDLGVELRRCINALKP